MVVPRVTVLMPVYNAEHYLREAINSILAQSFKPFEFLIIDDGSTDRSAEIIRAYTDPRIRFVRNVQNMGITATLNKGISLASCDLIARMDADDISHPHRLQKQFGYMKRNPRCAMLSTWARVITEDKKFVRLERYRSNLYFYNLTFECWIYHPTVMFRKSSAEEVGMYSLPYSEDYDFFWRVSMRFPIANLAEPLVDYRLSETSLNTVLKKREYDLYNEKNVRRNLRHYLGDDFEISHPALECLRHNFQPVLSDYSLREVLDALSLLDTITKKIIESDNVNVDVKAIRCGRHFKRKFILEELRKKLPFMKAFRLLLYTGAWMTMTRLVKSQIDWRTKEVIRKISVYISAIRFRNFSSEAVKNS